MLSNAPSKVELRREIQLLRVEVAKLASINEMLSAENEILRMRGGEDTVVPLRTVGRMAKIRSIE